MMILIELYKALDSQETIYTDAKEYADGEKKYDTSPYMQEFYKNLLPSLKTKLVVIKGQIITIENKLITGVRS